MRPARPGQSSSPEWRGPALAALIALIAGLPGVFALPPLDRDESRFAQATAQMLEQDDYVVIRFQDQPRFKKPVGIHWLQAASVSLVSSPEARQIWAYRLPSLLGAMLAAAACAWAGAALFDPRTGLIAGALLGSSLLLSTEASIAKTDAVLCGAVTLALAALARLYAQANGGPAAGRGARMAFWLGISLSILVKGPIGPMVAGLTLLALGVADRRARWMAELGWGWGLVLTLAVVGPWAWAVTVATDGGFWSAAIAGDLAPKLAGAQESHGAPPGFHLLATPFLFFPGVLLAPAAAALAWTGRREPGVRFAAAWLIPSFLVFELTPTKLVHYTLPVYGALALLAAASIRSALGPVSRWTGAGLALVTGGLLSAGCIYLVTLYGDADDWAAGLTAAVLLAAAGLAGGVLLLIRGAGRALTLALILGVAGHAVLVGLLAPGLSSLWLSRRVEVVLAQARLLPRQGMAPAPLVAAGYAEPSLVFAVGTPTDLGDGPDAAAALADGRPAVVEAREEPAFRDAAARLKFTPHKIGEVRGLDYSNGDQMSLSVYAPETAP